ncbi:hypothetical protein PINS_up005116 [Pythium insidiosum]|nr:hypothetical protein PINS_up005116 [Pythium insidiosum]
MVGGTSILACKPCPPGVYGSSPGLTTSSCTGPCPSGKYGMRSGLQSLSECLDCPPNYRGPNGHRGDTQYGNYQGGFPCDRYIKGNAILNGRDKEISDFMDAFYANPRLPFTERNDNT